MTTIDMLVSLLPGVERPDLERWISNAWVRPDNQAGQYVFHDIDVARAHLILELQDEMQVNDDAMPIVLSLLDQLYALRRRVRELGVAADDTIPDALRQQLLAALQVNASR